MQMVLCKRFAKELLKSYKFKINQKEKFMNFIHFSRVTKILLSLSLVISLGCDDDRKSTNKQPQPQTATRQNPLQSGEDRSNSEVSQPTTSLSETQSDPIPTHLLPILSHLNLRDLNALKDNVANFIALQPIFRQFQSKGTPSCESEITAIHDRLLVSIDNISPDRINEDWSEEDWRSYNSDTTIDMRNSFNHTLAESKRKWEICSAHRSAQSLLEQTPQKSRLYSYRREFVNFLEEHIIEFVNSEDFTNGQLFCQQRITRDYLNYGKLLDVLFTEERRHSYSLAPAAFEMFSTRMKDEWKSCNYNRLKDFFTPDSFRQELGLYSEELLTFLSEMWTITIKRNNRDNMECLNQLYTLYTKYYNEPEQPSLEEIQEQLNPVCEIRD